jgi:hypothetical protein
MQQQQRAVSVNLDAYEAVFTALAKYRSGSILSTRDVLADVRTTIGLQLSKLLGAYLRLFTLDIPIADPLAFGFVGFVESTTHRWLPIETQTSAPGAGTRATGDGGAVRNIQSSAGSFTGCTFAGNTADGTGGAFINDSSPATTIGSSEFCENSPNHIAGSYNDAGGNDFDDECPDDCPRPADLNCDGVVDGADLLILLGDWG